MKAIRTYMVLVLPLALVGCWTASDGHRHHLVLGVGLVTTRDSIDRARVGDGVDAAARHTRAVGAFLSTVDGMAGLHLGYRKHQTLIVTPEANLLIDAQDVDGEFRVSVWRPGSPVTEAPIGDQ